MQKTLLIIGPKTFENESLLKAARKRKFKVTLFSIKDFAFISTKKELKLYCKKSFVKAPNICIIRGTAPYDAKARIIARFLHNKGTKIVDHVLVSKNYELHKMGSTVIFEKNKIPHIPTYYFSTWEEITWHLKRLPAELVVKDIKGRKSKNLFCLKISQLEKFFKDHCPANYIMQPKIDGDFCYRVLVVGDRVLGAMRKIGYFHRDKKNIPDAEKFIKVGLSRKIEKMCLATHKAFDYDISGLDVIFDGETPKILEINRCPGFKGFITALNMDVADEIINHIEKLK